MALIEREVEVTTKHGRCLSFTACPDAEGTFPGVILYLDAPGYREELKNRARRIARVLRRSSPRCTYARSWTATTASWC